MKQIKGDLWDFEFKHGFNICITTNGFVKKDGNAVMGRGCAKEAADRYPSFPKDLGVYINLHGNESGMFWFGSQCVVTFPVKHAWYEKADLELIKRSTQILNGMATSYTKETFILPRPGCGNGHLDWEEVRPLLEMLPDNVWVISK